jgi:periplasmic copper chaperone A
LRTPAILAACLALCALALRAWAAPPPLSVSDAWIRATPGAAVAAAYLTLHNGGNAPVTVTGVRSSVAGMAMIHQTQLIGTQSTMRARAALEIAPGETLQFAPGGLHVMLQELAHPLQPGEDVPLLLLLKDGGTVSVVARVRALSGE